MSILLFAGAGTSIELGVPGMVDLAIEFLAHAEQREVEVDLVKKLMDQERDVEYLIERVDRVCEAIKPVGLAGLDAAALTRAQRIRSELEWFVQHAAERVSGRDAQLMWGPVIEAATASEITFVTTNYDRAIEVAANAESVRLNDGFVRARDGEAERWSGFDDTREGPVLVKLHGSTNWYADGNTQNAIKLRHPMPLFGDAQLLFESYRLGSALVLPSREKMLTREPYPRMSQLFLNASDQCDVALFVGSSLRDLHVRDAAQSAAKRASAFIVNPDGDNYGVRGADVIAQTASTFLVSTLPNALAAQDPKEVLYRCAQSRGSNDRGVFNSVKSLMHADTGTLERCHAIDELDSMEVTLPPKWIRRLIGDRDSTVARYALGLIATSSEADVLIEEAGSSRHMGDTAYRSDYHMLREVMRR